MSWIKISESGRLMRNNHTLLGVLRANFKPRYSSYHKIGVEASKFLSPVLPLSDLATIFGRTEQNLYHESVAALGKLVFGIYHGAKMPQDGLHQHGTRPAVRKRALPLCELAPKALRKEP